MDVVIYILYYTSLGFDEDFLYVQYARADDDVIITSIVYAFIMNMHCVLRWINLPFACTDTS